MVLTVKDVGITCRFYTTILGMQHISFGNGRNALHFGQQKINLHQQGSEIAPKARNPVPGSADVCLISSTPLEEIIAHLQKHDIPVEAGPVTRTGALGPIRSVYLRDPDLNLIEVANY